jgi:hypothetical protein
MPAHAVTSSERQIHEDAGMAKGSHRLSNATFVMSVALTLVMAALWTRTVTRSDFFSFERRLNPDPSSPGYQPARKIFIWSSWGTLRVIGWKDSYSNNAGEGWHYKCESNDRLMWGGFYCSNNRVWWTLGLPYWFLCVVASILGAAVVVSRRRARQLASAPRCESCGYDLRATPARCPECGKIPATPTDAPARSPADRSG